MVFRSCYLTTGRSALLVSLLLTIFIGSATLHPAQAQDIVVLPGAAATQTNKPSVNIFSPSAASSPAGQSAVVPSSAEPASSPVVAATPTIASQPPLIVPATGAAGTVPDVKDDRAYFRCATDADCVIADDGCVQTAINHLYVQNWLKNFSHTTSCVAPTLPASARPVTRAICRDATCGKFADPPAQ
jgi:hypothetical protein